MSFLNNDDIVEIHSLSPSSVDSSVDSPVATPTPSPTADSTSSRFEDDPVLSAYLWQKFPGYLFTQRSKPTSSWVWSFGYDIEKSDKRLFVCKVCIRKKDPTPATYDARCPANVAGHLYMKHRISAPNGRTKSSRQVKVEMARSTTSTPEPVTNTIPRIFGLDVGNSREQAIANTIIQNFDKQHFRRLLITWIVSENHAFSIVEDKGLRDIFKYLNPCVEIQQAHISNTTIHTMILDTYRQHKMMQGQGKALISSQFLPKLTKGHR